MKLRVFLGVLSGLALGACVVATNDGDRDPASGGKSGASGSSGAAGTGGIGGSSGSAGRADASPDVASGGTGDAGIDSASDDAATDGTSDGGGTGGAATDGATHDGGGSGGSGGATVSVQCRAIVDACPALALAECQLYLAGMTASARAWMVACVSSGCNLASCARDL
jgi:hypothetical protein